MSSQRERLQKLYALAMRGIGGEKEQAQAMLEKLTKKYAISMQDLDEEVVQDFVFEYHGDEQERILIQTIYMVTDDKNSMYNLRYTASGKACKTKLGARCTAAQKVEIESLFDFHKKLWEREKEALLQAYFQKHHLFGSLKDGEKAKELSPEELRKMEALIKGLSDDKPLKQIEAPRKEK